MIQSSQYLHTFIILQEFCNHGVSFEKAIYAKQGFCESRSLYFWFTVLRKLYKYEQNEEKPSDFKEAVTSLITKIEMNLNSIKNFEMVPKTTRLFLAVEENKHGIVKSLLETYPELSLFLDHMKLIPGTIFPFESQYHSCCPDASVSVSPIGQ